MPGAESTLSACTTKRRFCPSPAAVVPAQRGRQRSTAALRSPSLCYAQVSLFPLSEMKEQALTEAPNGVCRTGSCHQNSASSAGCGGRQRAHREKVRDVAVPHLEQRRVRAEVLACRAQCPRRLKVSVGQPSPRQAARPGRPRHAPVKRMSWPSELKPCVLFDGRPDSSSMVLGLITGREYDTAPGRRGVSEGRAAGMALRCTRVGAGERDLRAEGRQQNPHREVQVHALVRTRARGARVSCFQTHGWWPHLPLREQGCTPQGRQSA